jgi:TRAP-type C4-dicarboxylate transport system substrate-binding protein
MRKGVRLIGVSLSSLCADKLLRSFRPLLSCSYFALTEHTMTPDVLIMSMNAWRSLSPADQNIFRNAALDSNIFLRGHGKIGRRVFRKQALDLGVTVTEIDRKPLEAALTGLYTKVLTDSHSKHLVEAIQRDR